MRLWAEISEGKLPQYRSLKYFFIQCQSVFNSVFNKVSRTMKVHLKFLLFLLFSLSQNSRVNSQAVCCYLPCFQHQIPSIADPDNAQQPTEPNLQNIFSAPESCPRGFMPIHGKCRQIYSQQY